MAQLLQISRYYAMGVVNVLVNDAFDGYVKIGKTRNLDQRLRSLDNTSVPLPFRCVYAVEVPNDDEVERLLHQTFADLRIRSSREFFDIDPQRVISAMKLTACRDVTPKDDIAADEDGLRAIEKTARRPRKVYSLFDADLKVGDIVSYANNSAIEAEVVDGKTIRFEGAEASLSASAVTLLNRDGYRWRTANGWQYWMYQGETIAERLNRCLRETSDLGS